MPSNAESPLTESRQEFCRALKAARQRRGLTLEAIAATTKIAAYHFAALERGDVSRWPKGLFRRSFFRDYAGAIGLPVGESCEAFIRLFPDDECGLLVKSAPAADATPAEATEEVRLVFDTAWHGPRTPILSRLLAAVLDVGLVLVVAGAVAWGIGLDPASTVALTSLVYFSLATLCLGGSPAKWAVAHRGVAIDAVRHGTKSISGVWSHGSGVITTLFGAGSGAAEQREESTEVRTWITDARRVGPSRFRVRIKVPQ